MTDSNLRPIVSFALLGTLLTVGHALRARIRLLRVLSLPASCVGGIVGLVARQLLLRNVAVSNFVDRELIVGWSELPSLLTNVVFVTLVLGEPLPSPTQLWRLSGSQLAFGQLLAFGQYAACALLVAVWLGPAYGVPRLFAAIVPLGYEGGHGVVAGNRAALERYNYPQGLSLGYVAATVGLLVGTLLGCMLANWARWRGLLASQPQQPQDKRRLEDSDVDGNASDEHQHSEHDVATGSNASAGITNADSAAGDENYNGHGRNRQLHTQGLGLVGPSYADFDGCYPESSEDRPRLGTCVVAVSSLDSLAHHLSIVGVVLSCAWCAKLGVSVLSDVRLDGSPVVAALRATSRFLDPLPLFLYALLCAVCVQAAMDRSARCRSLFPLDRDTASSICATAQDFLIVSAIATIEFDELAAAATPFFLCCLAAALWVFLCFLFCARLLPDFWIERAVTEVGLSLGATATALLVLRMMDPENRTPVLRAFCYKQLINVMLVGGGLFTSSSLTISHTFGPWGLFAVSACGVGFWLTLLVVLRARVGTKPSAGASQTSARGELGAPLLGGGVA